MKTVTQWFQKGVKPVHVGVYEVHVGFGGRYSYWNGSEFGFFSTSPEKVESLQESMHPALQWRGLAVKP